MSNEVEQKKSITERVPVAALALVQSAEGDVDQLIEDFEFEYPDIRLTRGDARELMKHVVLEKEADELATAPSGIQYLLSQADKMLLSEIERMAHDQKVLTKIANASEAQDYRITLTGEVISPIEARQRLDNILKRLLEIKKSLSEDVKASAKGGDTQFNLQFNLGEVLTDTISNIRSSASVKQVESTASKT